MELNTTLLRHFTVLYIFNEIDSNKNINTLKTLFNHVLIVDDYSKVSKICNTLIKKIDLILLDSDIIKDSQLSLLKEIRHLDKKVPFILITKELNNEILNHSIEYKISSFLLKPLQIKLLANSSLSLIQKYHRSKKLKNALKKLSSELSDTKDKNIKLSNKNDFLSKKVDFYENLHSKYLNSLTVNTKGTIISVSPNILEPLNEELIGKSINTLFKNYNIVNKNILKALQTREIVSITETVILEEKSMKEFRINIFPLFEENDNGCNFLFIFN